jgi:hypothetical protein
MLGLALQLYGRAIIIEAGLLISPPSELKGTARADD